MLLLALVGKACSILFFFGAWFYYIPPKAMTNGEDDFADNKKQQVNGDASKHVEKY